MSLSSKLAKALQSNDVRAEYARAVKECDEAWSFVEALIESGFVATAREAHQTFRRHYAEKCRLYHQILAGAA